MEIIHKDDDCMWLYCEESDTTVYLDLNVLYIPDFMLGMSAIAILLDCKEIDLVQIHSDGLRIDGKFIQFEFIPAIIKGVKMSDLHLVGHLYQ